MGLTSPVACLVVTGRPGPSAPSQPPVPPRAQHPRSAV